MSKVCSNCGKEKDSKEFYADKTKSTGLSSRCKKCARFKKEQRRKNKAATCMVYNGRPCKKCGSIKKLTVNSSCVDCTKERDRARQKTPKKKAYLKAWAKLNSDKTAKAKRAYAARMRANPKTKARFIISGMVTRCATEARDISRLPYSASDLIKRMECQFTKGMSWDNHGEWEIDHKIPISIFFSRGETRVNIINALSNLQPLWRSENRSKGARYVG